MLEILATLVAVSTGAAPTPGLAPGPTEPEPLNAPASWITADDYPVAARAMQLEGLTVALLAISPEGQVRDCVVNESSGHDVLDEATCRILRQRALFSPARDAQGLPTGGTVTQRVVWRMPQVSHEVGDGSAQARMSLATSGSVFNCEMETSGTLPDEFKNGLCPKEGRFPPAIVRAIQEKTGLGNHDLVVSVSFSKDAKARETRIAEREGWEHISLTKATLTLNDAGWLSDCHMEETRGPANLIVPICLQAAANHFTSADAKRGGKKGRTYWFAFSYAVREDAD